MQNLKTLILTAIVAICCFTNASAQETHRGKNRGKVVMTGRPGSILVLGGGTSMPSSNVKDKAFLSNSTAINADVFLQLKRWTPVLPKPHISIGLNISAAYNFGGSGGFGTTPNPFAVTGQTSSTVSPRGTDPAQAGFRMGAGPQANFYFGKFIVSPMVLGEYFSMTQKEMSSVQTTQFNGQSYDFNLATLPETKTSGFAVTPKLRLHYMFNDRFGLFANASYTMGPKIETQLTKLVPNGNPNPQSNSYNIQQLQTGTMVKGETKSTAYSAMGLHFGVIISLEKNKHETSKNSVSNARRTAGTGDIRKGWNGKLEAGQKIKTKSNSTNERTARDDSSGIRKGWNGTVPMAVPNNGVSNQAITISVMGNGNTTADGIPIVNSRTITGNIKGLEEPATVTISQSETNDIGTGKTDADGHFEITVKGDTTHKIYVNGAEFGKIKIITDGSDGSDQSSKTTSCTCGTWSPLINFQLYPTGLLGGSFTNQTMACGGTFNLNIGNAVKIATTNFTCLGGCLPYIKATVLHNGVAIPSLINVNLGTVAEQPIPECGDYQIVLKSKCVATPAVPCPDSCVLNFHVACPDTTTNPIDCCKESKWGEVNRIKKNGTKVLIQCGQDMGVVKCNEAATLNATYFCNPQCQPATAQLVYQIYSNSGVPYGTSQTVSSGANVTIMTPTVTGSWYVSITALCGGDTCGVCKINFSTDCAEQQPDCCKGGYWKDKSVQGLPQVSCGITLPNPIPCGATKTVNFSYNCNTSSSCIAQINYTIKDAAGNVVSNVSGASGVPKTITMPATSGAYCLVVYALCNNQVCDSCKICFNVSCQQQTDCCKGGKWLTKYYGISAPLIKTMPVEIKCDSTYTIEQIANGSITFNADYLCNPALGNCTKQVLVSVKKPGTSFNILQPVSYSLPLSEAGTYNVCYIAVCGKDTCAKCCFTVVIKEKKDCCKGSYWQHKSIDWSNTIDKSGGDKTLKTADGPVLTLPVTSIDITNCNTSYKLSQGIAYTFNADYNCAKKDCPKMVKVKIKGLTNSSLDGIYTAPTSKTFTSPGSYMITYYAYCGDQLCDSCVFTVTIDKNCCAGSKWLSADYQLVNKKADGSWDWVPGINPIGNSVPTLKADLGIDISHLNFQCAQGCAAGYIVRRLNLSTGTLAEPDETLAPGQTTTSIYSKPYPQFITIIPTCNGQKCTPLMFRVECINKNCCVSEKITFSTGMTLTGSVATGAEPQWYSAIPLTILSPGTAPLFATGTGTDGGATILQNQTNLAPIPYYTAKRNFTVSKSCTITISGKLGISRWDLVTWASLFRSFKLFKGTTEVWNHVSVAPGSVGTYETNDFNGNIAVTPGVYTFVFEYYKASNDKWLKNAMFVTGQIKGNILPTSGDCCPLTTKSTGTTISVEQTTINLAEENNTCNLAIGQAYQGGKIAYILKPGDPGYDANVCHGLVVSLQEVPGNLCWGCYGTAVGTLSTYGSGMANTLAMAAVCPSASIATYCLNLIEGGYSDWHLPSKDELAKVFLAKNIIGGFSLHTYYATSTEYSSYLFFCGGYFHDASTTYLQGTTSKSCWDFFRAVHYF